MIQPTPCLSPSRGSQESFSDVPRHTGQLLPAVSERFRKSQQHHHRHQLHQQKTPPSSVVAAPIASIRTSCSSCSDDAASTATTVNSSVFADDCCCTTTSPLLPALRPPLKQPPPPSPFDRTAAIGEMSYSRSATVMASASSAAVSYRRKYSPPPAPGQLSLPLSASAGNPRDVGHLLSAGNQRDVGQSSSAGAAAVHAAVRPFHDFHRKLPPHQPPTSSFGGGAGSRNVIVVQADVNPIADTIVNANSLSGSLRTLYDASKETLF